MSTETFGSALIVWLGPRRYAFPPGRDVTVGVDGSDDIRLEPVNGVPAPQVVLHYDGSQWIAVDRNEAGLYVDGVRMSTVFVHDGRAITLGDPQHGPQLVFQLPAPAPPPQLPPPPPRWMPTEPPPPRWVPPEPRPVPPEPAQTAGAHVTETIQKLIPRRPKVQPHPAGPGPQTPVPTTIAGRLEARRVRLSVDGEQALADLSFTAAPGTLTSVVGLSEASTSALVDVLSGTVQPSVGEVDFDGHDVAADDVRPHVGVVPRHDLLRPQLTVEQSLRFAAELRLPPDTPADRRREIIRSVMDRLELTALRTAQARTLTAEQRKRGSLAVELLTDPSLIVFDEPTAGLNPQAAQRITALLRGLADEGRVVLEATTAPTDLEVCDQVVLLTPTGIPVFAGEPSQIGPQLGTTDWEAIVRRATTDPYGAHDEYLARLQEPPPPEPPAPSDTPVAPAVRRNTLRQIAVCTRRQAWVTVADQRYCIFLTILPALFGATALLIPGDAGLGPASRYGGHPDQAVSILAVLTLGAIVMGTAIGIRDLFGEQRIFRREQAHGLSASAFLAGKAIVYTLTAIIQTAVVTAVTIAGHKAPTHGATLLGHGRLAAGVELFIALAVTAVVTALVTLAFSSLATYFEQILLIAALVVLVSAVFTGALFPISARFPLEQLAALVPSRWGFAAAAATVDVHAVNPLAEADGSWRHSSGQWSTDIVLVLGFGVLACAALRWRLRRPSRRHQPPSISAHSAR